MTRARDRKRRVAACPPRPATVADPRALAAEPVPIASARNHSLDALRGLAILLMVADHVAGILLRLPLDSAIRTVTRLAEPLFVVLFGYLLATRDRRRVLRRVPHLALAALISNALFFPAYRSLEILVSFIGVVVLYLGLGRHLVLLAPLVLLLQRWDPTAAVLDYPLALVASQVALGMLLRHRHALAFAALYLIVPLMMSGPDSQSHLVSFTALAVVAVIGAVKSPRWRVPVLDQLGRHPLKAYVAQFLVVFAIGAFIGAPAIGRIKAWYGLTGSVAPSAGPASRAQPAGAALLPPDPALPCLGPALPLTLIHDMPVLELTLAGAHGPFVVDFATTASTVDPRELAGPTPRPLPGTTDRWESLLFFGRWPAPRLIPEDYRRYRSIGRRAGILGTDFLATRVIAIDWTRMRLHSADRDKRCSPEALAAAGFVPLSSAGYYGATLDQLVHDRPNVPTVPLRIGPVQVPAQIDTAFDDHIVRHSLNVNRALYDRIVASGIGLTRAADLDLSISTCTGVSLAITAHRLPPGLTVELVGEDAKAARRYQGVVLFLKQDTAETAACGGIGTWDEPAAQLGASFMAEVGRIVADPFAARVWLQADGAKEPR